MGMRLLTPDRYRRMPWRNGRGMTTELAREPEDGMGNFLWRVSISEVSRQGPFSLFPGYDRLVAVIEGEGMDLLLDGSLVERLSRKTAPYTFSGDRLAECRLIGGMIRDFNLIVDRHYGRATLHRIRKGPGLTVGGLGSVVLIYAVSGEAWIRFREQDEEQRIRLEEEHTLILEGDQVEITCPAAEAEALVSEVSVVGRANAHICIGAMEDNTLP
ncbi:HutD family protein [Haematospirillum sp. 15-248]|uniref:HutD/Ves family protein n=1 Tax=Haematospirillum sp. 15-248 TaxID=2723107 RepID=UPI0014395DC2|nr:HutD family protein [Haematospirillum sp. 15-248]NKD88773.1 HutD family protein [Haematospirillum sp. 15-248]